MHAKSEILRENKKWKVADLVQNYIAKIETPDNPYKWDDKLKKYEGKVKVSNEDKCKQFYSEARFYVLEEFRKAGQKLPLRRYFQDDMVDALYRHPACPEQFRKFLMQRMF